ncbi:hypothetical protein B296_00054450, partial [Ensete ventricosum]
EVWPHACCLHAEVAGHGQAPYRGGWPWPGYLQGATDCSQGPPARGQLAAKPPAMGDRPQGQQPGKGGHPWAWPAMASPRTALPLAIGSRPLGQQPGRGGHPRAWSATGPVASKGDDASRRGGRTLAGRLPAIKGSQGLRRGSDGGDVVRVKEG